MNAKGAFCPLHTSPAALSQTFSARFFDSLNTVVFPPFITARMGQKIGRRPQTQLCGDALENSKHSRCPYHSGELCAPACRPICPFGSCWEYPNPSCFIARVDLYRNINSNFIIMQPMHLLTIIVILSIILLGCYCEVRGWTIWRNSPRLQKKMAASSKRKQRRSTAFPKRCSTSCARRKDSPHRQGAICPPGRYAGRAVIHQPPFRKGYFFPRDGAVSPWDFRPDAL